MWRRGYVEVTGYLDHRALATWPDREPHVHEFLPASTTRSYPKQAAKIPPATNHRPGSVCAYPAIDSRRSSWADSSAGAGGRSQPRRVRGWCGWPWQCRYPGQRRLHV